MCRADAATDAVAGPPTGFTETVEVGEGDLRTIRVPTTGEYANRPMGRFRERMRPTVAHRYILLKLR